MAPVRFTHRTDLPNFPRLLAQRNSRQEQLLSVVAWGGVADSCKPWPLAYPSSERLQLKPR